MKIPTIETPRRYLRSFKKEDARFAIGIWNDPEMGEYLPDEAMKEIDEDYVREIEALPEDEDCCYLISELKDTHIRIGTCSFMVSDNGRTYDIAYCVHRDYWRNGYATEAAKGMIGYAIRQGADKITVRVNKENIASNKIARKLGFRVTGETTYKKRGTEKEFSDYLYELQVRPMTEEFESIRDAILREVKPLRIILYGVKRSPAGDRLKEANLCVVVRDGEKEAERRLYRALDLDFPFNLLLYSAETWQSLTADPTSYAASIRAKGVTLYEEE